MSHTFTFPGVFIEEIPSGGIVTIAGVATAITAFVGRTLMGPAAPTDCFSCCRSTSRPARPPRKEPSL